MSNLVTYGEDGPVFDRGCPKCRLYLKFPREMRWREDITGRCKFDVIDCPRCGAVDPEHVGWGGDFR